MMVGNGLEGAQFLLAPLPSLILIIMACNLPSLRLPPAGQHHRVQVLLVWLEGRETTPRWGLWL